MAGTGLSLPAFYRASKAQKLEKQLAEKMTSLSNLELVVLDLELRGHTDNIDALEKTAQSARAEIYRRISQDEQVEILKFFLPALKARPDSILSNEKAFLPQGPKGILQDFLSVNDGNITDTCPYPQTPSRPDRGHSIDRRLDNNSPGNTGQGRRCR